MAQRAAAGVVHQWNIGGNNIQVQTNVLNNGQQNIPVADIEITTMQNLQQHYGINDFTLLLENALRDAYALALAHLHVQPDQNDQVSVMIENQTLVSNPGHSWYSNNHTMGNQNGNHRFIGADAVQRITDAFEDSIQSNQNPNLSDGATTFTFQFICFRQGHRVVAPRQRRIGGNQAKKQKPMFPHYHRNQFFEQSYLIDIPIRPSQDCFPLSFLLSQCRSLEVQPTIYDQWIIKDVRESKPITPEAHNVSSRIFQLQGKGRLSILKHPYGITDSYGCHYLIPLTSIQQKYLREHQLSHYMMRQYLILFNPYKMKDLEIHYDHYAYMANIVHQHVESQLRQTIDKNHLEVVVQAYANVFQVNIHLRRMEADSYQTDCFRCETVREGYDRHIVLLLKHMDDSNVEHCYPVLNIRDMVISKFTKAHTNISGYCDYCTQCVTENNQSKENNLKHLGDCRPSFLRGEELPEKATYKEKLPQFHFYYDKEKQSYTCGLCKGKQIENPNAHRCRMPYPESKENNKSSEEDQRKKYFVFDLECAQQRIFEEDSSVVKFRHVCTLICLRSMYTYENFYRQHFWCLEDFIKELMTNSLFHGATLFAHNGGSYDMKLIVHYLEQHGIPDIRIPRPGSVHKYLSLEIRLPEKSKNIIFKDFLMFMPGSLKGIAKSLGCQLSKGDFPHRFHTLENLSYVGSIPPLNHEEDFFCLKQKRELADVQELEIWHREESLKYCTCWGQPLCTCGKPRWNLKEQLLTYCWLDVDVLAECMVKFRDQHLAMGSEDQEANVGGWQLKPLDPYCFLTQSQVAQKIFLRGHHPDKMPAISISKLREGWSKESLVWLEYLMERDHIFIQHAGNSYTEYYDTWTRKKVDGYCSQTRTFYEFYGCFYHGCPRCYAENRHQKHRLKSKMTIEEVYQDTMDKLEHLKEKHFGKVVHIWECQAKFFLNVVLSPEKKKYMDGLIQNVITDREMFFGGRTEVFCPYARADENHSLEYHDVTSLYPTVCARDMLPIGIPIHYFGYQAQQQHARLNRRHPDPIFGYVRCEMIPNRKDFLGLLPQKVEGEKLTFDLHPKTGTWFTEEIYLAMEQGYLLGNIYEIYHFDADQRSDSYMRGYISYFFRQKQEAEGWMKSGASCENPQEEEQQQIIENLYQENPDMLRMRASKVQKNDVLRQLAKLYLNCLWGKFGQSPDTKNQKNFYGLKPFLKIIHDDTIDKKTIQFRQIHGDYYQALYVKNKEHQNRNAYYNVWIAAAVTAHARCRLHKQMLKIGPERILYCDTDSIIFRHLLSLPSYAGRGLGNWASEIKSGEAMIEFYGLAPKSYQYICVAKQNPELQKIMTKSKGVVLTIENQRLLQPETYQRLIKKALWETVHQQPCELLQNIELAHFTIQSNSVNSRYDYAEMFSIYTRKLVQAVYSKRRLEPEMVLIGSEETFARGKFQDMFSILRTFPRNYDFLSE